MSRVALPSIAVSRRFALAGGAALAGSLMMGPAFAAGPSAFLDRTWRSAKERGVSKRTFDAALGGFEPLNSVIKLTGKQPEFVSTAADYIDKRVTDERAGTGQRKRAEWAETLAAVGQRFGVQAEVVLAIWGIETSFGGYLGGTNSVHGLATLTYAGYRPEYFGRELLVALDILEAGHVSAKKMVGSWAGAMGHPQFMPTSFVAYAVDMRGDGHKDIWGSVPDALGSIGNYLSVHGWRTGETWGYEVALPAGFNYSNVWAGTRASLRDWADIGVRRANGRAFPRETDVARLYMPMGGHGPVFAVLPNFEVIKAYNKSDSYALSVGHLADRIIGGGNFVAGWPKDTALKKAERLRLQELLGRRGYSVGTPDGVVGAKTRAAIMDFQASAGLLPDGHASGNLLKALG